MVGGGARGSGPSSALLPAWPLLEGQHGRLEFPAVEDRKI